MPVSDAAPDTDMPATVRAGDLLWTPPRERVENANITAFMAWLRRTRGLEFGTYPELWEWSVTDLDAFWQAVWDYNEIVVAQPPHHVLGEATTPGAARFSAP